MSADLQNKKRVALQSHFYRLHNNLESKLSKEELFLILDKANKGEFDRNVASQIFDNVSDSEYYGVSILEFIDMLLQAEAILEKKISTLQGQLSELELKLANQRQNMSMSNALNILISINQAEKLDKLSSSIYRAFIRMKYGENIFETERIIKGPNPSWNEQVKTKLNQRITDLIFEVVNESPKGELEILGFVVIPIQRVFKSKKEGGWYDLFDASNRLLHNVKLHLNIEIIENEENNHFGEDQANYDEVKNDIEDFSGQLQVIRKIIPNQLMNESAQISYSHQNYNSTNMHAREEKFNYIPPNKFVYVESNKKESSIEYERVSQNVEPVVELHQQSMMSYYDDYPKKEKLALLIVVGIWSFLSLLSDVDQPTFLDVSFSLFYIFRHFGRYHLENEKLFRKYSFPAMIILIVWDFIYAVLVVKGKVVQIDSILLYSFCNLTKIAFYFGMIVKIFASVLLWRLSRAKVYHVSGGRSNIHPPEQYNKQTQQQQ